MPRSDRGQLCTDDNTVARFLARVYDARTGSLSLLRESHLWDVVESAHAAGKRGQGQKVGVLDAGFDLRMGRLAERAVWADPARAGDHVAGHGTAVALLINEVAPLADLVLHDVRPGVYVHPANVTEGLDAVLGHGVDIINLSLGFETEATRPAGGSLDVDLLFDLDADPAPYHAMLDRFSGEAGFFAPGGCLGRCPICARLTELGGTRPALIAAGGNTGATYCPAAHDACTGAGFHVVGHTTVSGRRQATSNLPDNDQSVWCEFVLPLPEQFDETSFAAPLLSGVAALDETPQDLTRILTAGRTVDVVVAKHQILSRRADEGTATYDHGYRVRAAYAHVLSGLPPGHHHWDHDDPPCAICALVVWKAYKGIIQTSIGVGEHDQALRWADAAVRLSPLSFELLLDKGAALTAAVAAGHIPSSSAAIGEAIGAYELAAARRPSDVDAAALCGRQIEVLRQLQR